MQQQGALDPEYLTRKHDMFAYLQSLPALKDAPKLVDTRVPAFHQEYEAENRCAHVLAFHMQHFMHAQYVPSKCA